MNDQQLSPAEEMLCDAALWNCGQPPAPELESILAADPSARREAFALEQTAAAIAAALASRDSESPPAGLRTRLEREAIGFAMERQSLSLTDVAEALANRPPVASAPAPAPTRWFSHLLTAAALVMAAVLIVTRDSAPEPVPVAVQRAGLMSASADLVRMDWQGDGVRGNVCWSDTRQEGFLTFRGLATNDPAEFQYQLWIFDRGREDTADRPVDGGVFDVNEGGEVIVPIRTNLLVHDAFAFAVTRERPGGVVVSAKDQIVTSAGL